MPAWLALLVALALAVPSPALLAQQMYRWVDKDGRVHYSQQPPAPGAAKNVEQKKMGAGSVAESQMPFALQQALKNYPVVLYTSPNCKTGCPDARNLLSGRGIPFREVSVFDNATNDVLKKATGDNKVPSITVGALSHVGYEPDAMSQLLDTAGYPRTPQIAVKPPAESAPEPAGASAPAPAAQPR